MYPLNALKKICFTTLLMAAVLLYGCDISDSNKSTVTEELSNEELEVAGQIIAESLSDQKDGIFASLNDAFSLPSSSNLTANSMEKGKYASPVFGAAMAKNSENNSNNYSYSYDPDEGTHLVNFSRTINDEDLSKESTAELIYIYYDVEGAFIYSPRLDSDLIETIQYSGFRSGSIITPNKKSSYERSDEFLIDGLTSGGPLTIEGLHEGSGQFEVTRDNGDVIKRDYTLTVEFLDVQINSETLSDGSLQKSVHGSLAYEMTISKNLNGSESIKTVNGTIEFNGDGTALLRFQNILNDFKVTLEQGNLIADNEFEGFVESVDTESDPQQFTLSDGNTYVFGTDTEIDSDGDLPTLEDVQSILETDIRVKAEGTFAENTAGAFILQTVEFEYEDDDLEFEDLVESVDPDAGILTLENGDVFDITDETNFDEEGDLSTLEGVLWALNNEYSVEAEGEFFPAEDGSNDVTQVKFEYDGEGFEFDGDVESADGETGTFILDDGNTYTILEGTTEFDEESDYSSLDEVITARLEGAEIEAEGDYAPQADGSLLVTKVKFESDEADDDNSDSPETENFEGPVESASAPDKTISVAGVTYHILQDTEFDDNIQSLGNLVGALQRGDDIFVEGESYNDGEKNIAVELEFDVDRNGEDSDVENEEFEFESTVSSIDAETQTFVLSSGLSLIITEETNFEDGDIDSFEELDNAYKNGDEIKAEGEYYINGDDNFVTEVEFEVEGRDEDDDEDSDDDGDEENEFGGRINSVNLSANSFELMNGRIYTLNTDTEFDNDGDLFSLEEVANDLNEDFVVTTEGIYDPQADGSRLVVSVTFESNRDDDDGDDDSDEDGDEDDEDREERDFEGSVSSPTSNTFTIGSTIYTVNDDSEIEGDGVSSMQDVIDAFNDGADIDAEGEYYVDGSDNLVIEVEFDIDRNEDGDDDDGEDDGEDDEDEEDEDREERDFEGSVSSITNNSFTLNGTIFALNNDSRVIGRNSLQDAMNALNNGDDVEAEGEYFEDGSDNIVIRVKFDIDRNEDGDDDDGEDDGEDDEDEEDEDREERDFEGSVSSATSTTFSLGGQTFTVNNDTVIEGVSGLQEVIDAINAGDEVDAEGEYYVEDSTNIVIEVEFDIDRNDDGDEGGDDDEDDEDDSDDDDEDDD